MTIQYKKLYNVKQLHYYYSIYYAGYDCVQYILLLYAIYYYGEQYFSLYLCFTDHKCCCFEAHWLQITAINMMGGRITGTVAWVVLLIGLSVSRADFRIISVSKCANHLAEFIYVICFMLEVFFEGG